MDGTEGSSANQSQPLTTQRGKASLVLAPKEYFLGPVFAATKQKGAREVTIRIKNEVGEVLERRYQIGGFHPMDPDIHPPALDVRHARAIFALLSFRDPLNFTQLIRFSLNELCRRYAQSNGGRYARAIKRILYDLTNAFIRVTDTKTGVAHSYRLIERVDLEERPIRRRDSKLAKIPHQLEMWFNGCTLSPEFAGLLSHITELQHLKLEVFTSIRSPLAQAIYLYIPSRAYYHDESKPFEINLTRLLEQVSFSIPRHPSKRKEIFTQHQDEGRSILQQLEGLETLTGKFHVQLAKTSDGTDWKLLAWVEKDKLPTRSLMEDSKLLKAFLEAGWPREELDRRVASIQPLADYEKEQLVLGNVEIEKNANFFQLARALMGRARFETLIGEAKSDEMEGRKAKKSPTARLIYRIMNTIPTPALPKSKR